MEESAINDILNAVRDGLTDSPEELQKFLILAATMAVDYKKAVCGGVKKRGTDARKSLGEIKKMALEMRKKVLEVRKSEPAPAAETK